MRYKTKLNYTWSPQVAYSVGLIASDGCLQSDGRHLDLTSKDIGQLECFKKAINKDINITKKFNSTGKEAYRVQFGDVAYYDFLLGTGLTPRKSKTLAKLDIPDAYYSHFLRGVFDGDGTCYAYNDPRWPKSYLFYIGFAGASMEFLQFLSSTNQRLFGVKGQSIRKSLRAASLVYGKSDGLKLYSNMYKKAGIFYLKRKREKLESFIKTNGNAIIL
jgi:hypothetical protein